LRYERLQQEQLAMGDGYVGFKNCMVAVDRMAGTAVIGCVAPLSL
jgi:hypothetical protein